MKQIELDSVYTVASILVLPGDKGGKGGSKEEEKEKDTFKDDGGILSRLDGWLAGSRRHKIHFCYIIIIVPPYTFFWHTDVCDFAQKSKGEDAFFALCNILRRQQANVHCCRYPAKNLETQSLLVYCCNCILIAAVT